MKKLSEILVAIMASLVLVLTPVILVGCNKTESMSVAQVNDLVANAATNFYSNHTRDGKEEFSAITYHWTQTSVNRENMPVEYKETAEAEDTVTRDLEFVTTINADYKVAVKKDGENLIAEYTITTTTTNNGYDTNADETLKTTTEKTTTVDVFRAVSYVEDEIALKKYNSLEEHPFLNKFKNDNHDIYKNAINMHETTDKVFIDYLNKMSAFCNKKYFVKLIKFLTLFRECINNINDNNDLEGNKEYTEINDAEKIPYFSNKFLNFLFPEGIEKNFEFTKEESIDLIQNICYWMYDNNFTSSYIILKNIR